MSGLTCSREIRNILDNPIKVHMLSLIMDEEQLSGYKDVYSNVAQIPEVKSRPDLLKLKGYLKGKTFTGVAK